MSSNMDKKKNTFGNVTFAGNVTFNGPMFDIHDNEKVIINSDKPQENDCSATQGDACQSKNENHNEMGIDSKVLKKAVSKVKQYMWATSAYAVLFCVCRDRYGYPNNMSQFEREFADDNNLICPTGTIVSAFRYNTYMKLNVDKWKENGVKERALILKDRFIEVMDLIISQKLS